jgi:hypothetical protein
MNPKTFTIKLKKCELCDFEISQFHHYFPETRGGEKTGSKLGVCLCPNHHLMANILQIQIENFCRVRGCMPEELKPSEFIEINPFFDEAFKSKILDFIMGYDWGRREHLIHIGVYE